MPSPSANSKFVLSVLNFLSLLNFSRILNVYLLKWSTLCSKISLLTIPKTFLVKKLIRLENLSIIKTNYVGQIDMGVAGKIAKSSLGN